MSRTTIDLDDEQLAAAVRELGSTSNIDTVNRLRACAVQAMLARRSQHPAAGIIDPLTAAAAEQYQAVVSH